MGGADDGLSALGPDRHDHCYAGPVVSGANIGTWAWTPFADDREAPARRWFGDTFHVDLPYRPLPNPEALQADLVTHTEAQRRADEVGDETVARDAGAKAERSRRWLRGIAELPLRLFSARNGRRDLDHLQRRAIQHPSL